MRIIIYRKYLQHLMKNGHRECGLTECGQTNSGYTDSGSKDAAKGSAAYRNAAKRNDIVNCVLISMFASLFYKSVYSETSL